MKGFGWFIPNATGWAVALRSAPPFLPSQLKPSRIAQKLIQSRTMLTVMRRTSALAAKQASPSLAAASGNAAIHSTPSAENQVAQRGDISELLAGNAAARNSVGAFITLY